MQSLLQPWTHCKLKPWTELHFFNCLSYVSSITGGPWCCVRKSTKTQCPTIFEMFGYIFSWVKRPWSLLGKAMGIITRYICHGITQFISRGTWPFWLMDSGSENCLRSINWARDYDTYIVVATQPFRYPSLISSTRTYWVIPLLVPIYLPLGLSHSINIFHNPVSPGCHSDLVGHWNNWKPLTFGN